MTNMDLNTAGKERMLEALDWAIFSLGVLSLTVAIGATVVTKTNMFASVETEPKQVEILAG